MKAAIKQKLSDRTMRLVKYGPEQWISQMFAKAKGRLDSTTKLEAVRLLTDLRALNAALEYAAHWNLEMPTLSNLRYDMPAWAKFFGQGDISNAFESMWLAEGQRHLLTAVPPVPLGSSDFTDEEMIGYGMGAEEIQELRQEQEWLVQWVGVPQGLAPAAPFWNVHIADALNRLFGEEWRQWFLLYVDDSLPFGHTRTQADARQRIFEVAMEVLGKALSDKVDNSITEEGHIAGLKYEHGGVVLDDAAVESVGLALKEVQESKKMNEKAARRLNGILIYASSAFEWDVNDQSWWPRTVAVINDSYKGASFHWTDECRRSVNALIARLHCAKRIPCHPAQMMREGWRLVVKSDGCNDGVGACLLLVRCDADGSVTPEMMLDASRVRLIATDSKVLSEAERKWLTFEVECYGMYRALKKWAGVLMRVGQLGEGQWPPLLWMDATVATSKWLGISVPSHIDHANAKELRFLGWAEKVSYVKWMGFDMRWIPGSANDFADLLSRMADRIGQAVEAQARVAGMCPISVMEGGGDGVPQGYDAVNLRLEKGDWSEVRRAYLEVSNQI